MSFNIIDAVKEHFTPQLIIKASSFLGESKNNTCKAISGILPTVLTGIISKSSSSAIEAKEVFQIAQESNKAGFSASSNGFFEDGGALLSMGSCLLKNVFGNRAESVINSIANFAGVNKSSAHSLLSIATPLALSSLGKYSQEANLNAGGLTTFLNNQKDDILNMLPGGLNTLATSLGLEKITNNGSSAMEKNSRMSFATNNVKETATNSSSTLKWVIPVLLAIATVAAWFLWKESNKKKSVSEITGDSTTITNPMNLNKDTIHTVSAWPPLTIDPISGITKYDLGDAIEFTLPGGGKFIAAEKGFESQLLEFITDGSNDRINKSANWLNMFDVQFKTGGNIYAGKAEAQLENCAAILKDYPSVKIKLGGYTDNTGSADANTKISQQRADKVKASLIKMGANTDQITEAVGYGPLFPVCEANDTKECRARNRRVACKVAVK